MRTGTEALQAAAEFLSGEDLRLFSEGRHRRIYRKMGAHLIARGKAAGAHFAVWAPRAREVFVKGDFNDWSDTAEGLEPQGGSGIWAGFVPGVRESTIYKYHIITGEGEGLDKNDPVAFWHERDPRTASMVWDLAYEWGDDEWMAGRGARQGLDRPLAIYEAHLGSWMRVPEEGDRFLRYRELGPKLAEYARGMGFTHVELLPVMEHPFYGSWGYQTTGYFAPTSRYGMPQDLMGLIDGLHQREIGVILDWVPSHFPDDPQGLARFDGAPLYEHGDPRRGWHAEWKSRAFNYERAEVRSFLVSSAMFWLELYHADGLRVDGVASMLYRDYGRKAGEWIRNEHGGRENLEAVDFLRRLNEAVYGEYPDVQTIAEESSAWPMVSRPVGVGGLGFGLKWDMGWRHDLLSYLGREPRQRRCHHEELTFRGLYYAKENYVLPLSHDEVGAGKGSLVAKMPGDKWQQYANLRLLAGYQYGQPGKKLLFMGDEFGQWEEWRHDRSLDWHLVKEALPLGMQRWVKELNAAYRGEPALHEWDTNAAGFEWVDCRDAEHSTISWLRWSRDWRGVVLVVCNFMPVVRRNYRVGAPFGGHWVELLNSDARAYGGSGQGNLGGLEASPFESHGRPHTLTMTLPPLAMLMFKPAQEGHQ